MDASLQSRAEQLAGEFAGEAWTIEDLNGMLRLMMKSALERMLNTELDVHLGRRDLPNGLTLDGPSPTASGTVAESSDATAQASPATRRPPNRRNGRTPKTLQGDLGEITIATPRDRAGTFEPPTNAARRYPIGKYQRRVPGFDEKILALYAKAMTTRDIQEVVRELYGVEISATLVSEITADLDAEATAWRTRSLESVWPIVYFDGIVVHVRGANGRVAPHTVYVALGINLEGRKELLGLWLGESEGARFWLLPDRFERPRRARHLHRLHRWADRFPRRHSHGLSTNEGAVVPGASGAGRAALRQHRG
jgi:transposase-like protein